MMWYVYKKRAELTRFGRNIASGEAEAYTVIDDMAPGPEAVQIQQGNARDVDHYDSYHAGAQLAYSRVDTYVEPGSEDSGRLVV